MMQQKAKIWVLAALIPAVVFFACSKYKDPPPAQRPPGLDSVFYCNDPRAVNYNWGFPGTPDSNKCIFPVDSFLGTWLFADTIYLPSGDVSGTALRMLHFTSTEDSLLRHMAVAGWCGNPSVPFYITANKYGQADVDTMMGEYPGQYLCGNSDTLSGFFNKNTGAADTMRVELTIINASGTTFHKGLAIRQ